MSDARAGPAQPTGTERAIVLLPAPRERAVAAVEVVDASAYVVTGDGGSAVVCDDITAAVGVAAVATSLAHAGPATVAWLTRGEPGDEAAGLVVVQDGTIAAAQWWASDDDDDALPSEAAVLTAALGVPELTVAWRAFTRRDGAPEHLLASAVDLLGLSPVTMPLLTGPAPDDALWVTPTGRPGLLRRSLRAAAQSPAPDVVVLIDRFYWIVAALIAGYVAVQFVDAVPEDRLGYGVLLLITSLMLVYAVGRSKRARRHRRG